MKIVLGTLRSLIKEVLNEDYTIIWQKPKLEIELDEYFENDFTRNAFASHGITFDTEQELLNCLMQGSLKSVTRQYLESGKNLTVNPVDFEAELQDPVYRQSFEAMERKLLHNGSITLPTPIVFDFDGMPYGFAGNRRMNLAFKYGLQLKVWLVPSSVHSRV